MPSLEIISPNGNRSEQPLLKRRPLLIGSARASDIVAEGPGVAAAHCRVGWSKTGWSVTAATLNGVEVNGKQEEFSLLGSGDVIRVGNLRIVFRSTDADRDTGQQETYGFQQPTGADDPAAARGPVPAEVEEGGLKPISEENLELAEIVGSKAAQQRYSRSTEKEEPAKGHRPAGSAKPERLAGGRDRQPRSETSRDEQVRPVLDPQTIDQLKLGGDNLDLAAEAPLPPGAGVRPRGVVRPGEEDLLRSPLVLGLSALTLALLAAVVALWVWSERAARDRELAAAQTANDSGQYAVAIERWEKFLSLYPRDGRVEEIRLSVARARVERYLVGAAPDWAKAVQALDKMIEEYRTTPGFRDPESSVRTYVLRTAIRVALSAAQQAARLRRAEDLEAAFKASQLVELWSPAERPPKEELRQIDQALRTARTALAQQADFDKAVAEIDTHLKAKTLVPALDVLYALETRYRDALVQRQVAVRLEKILQLAGTAIERTEPDLPAMTDDPRDKTAPVADASDAPAGAASGGGPNGKPVSGTATELVEEVGPRVVLARRTRLRSDEASTGEGVLALAEDSLFRLDSVSGELLWRRTVGLDLPFFPVSVAGQEPGVLVYHTLRQELMRLQENSGQVKWRQKLAGRMVGRPLIYEGQIFACSAEGALDQIDLATGRLLVRLKLPQPLISGPAIHDAGDRLFVIAERGLGYVLSRRPLGGLKVFSPGHGPGAMSVEPFCVRDYLLLSENLGQKQSRLRLLLTADPKQVPKEISRLPLDGEIRQAPILRGKQLFVPLIPEGVADITLAATDDAQALTLHSMYRPPRPTLGPVHLVAGPDDQAWESGGAIRRLQLTSKSLIATKPELAVGHSAQPVQVQGDALFVGRRVPISRAVLFGRIERQQMLGQWQVTLGGTIAEVTGPAPDGGVTAVNQNGELFRITEQRFSGSPFEQTATGQITLPEGIDRPLLIGRITDGRVAVATRSGVPLLWLVRPESAVPLEFKLDRNLEAAPDLLAAGIVLPQNGRLRMQSVATDTANKGAIGEDWTAPQGGDKVPGWTAIRTISDHELIAVREDGWAAQLEWRKEPVPHLAEVTQASGLRLPGGRIETIDTDWLAVSGEKRLVRLSQQSLEEESGIDLPSKIVDGPWIVGRVAAVETEDGHLRGIALNAELSLQFDVPLPGEQLIGAPLPREEHWLCATRDGHLFRLDPKTGQIVRQEHLTSRLQLAPRLVGKMPFIGTLDGSLLSIQSWWER